MKTFLPLSTEEQLMMHLRGEILQGRLSGTMPGVLQLADILGSSPRTVTAAMKRLEHDGFLEGQGAGRGSRIVIPDGQRPPGMRIEMMLYEKSDLAALHFIETKHRLMEAGHLANFSPKSLLDLGMNVKRVARQVEKIETDAWMVVAGSQPVLEWFATLPVPTLGLFGRLPEIPSMPGVATKKIFVLEEIVQRLAALGHRRMVLLVREDRRLPQLGALERRFLELLEERGFKSGPYNLPDWEESAEGLCRCLDSLFAHSPPTAIIIDEAPLFMTARMHLAQRGIVTPRDVSLICLDPDPAFEWSNPTVSHVDWNSGSMIRRVLQWADNVARGREDRRKTFLKAEFIEGGTIGPVPGVAARKY